jgi:L-lactate dehydrogenase complex protein LldF
LEVTETDLGEYIIQLAGEKPSHLLAPALHKSRSEVGKLFAQELGMAYTDNIEQLAAAARRTLRHKFLDAELGVSGVNFGIAETGTIVILENEGNARLTTSLPRIHVAVMGAEKLIPRLQDLVVFLKLLPRSATGQTMTSYVSLITGAKTHSADEGPEQLHVVILDNGRSRLLADEVQREALFCIRCGACLNICPVYRSAGGHSYGWVYQGPIGALITPQLSGNESASELPFASSLCGACLEVCPVKINIPSLLLDLRSKVAVAHQPPSSRREAMLAAGFSFVMRHPAWYRLLAAVARRLQRLALKDGAMRTSSVPLLSAWTESRDFPAMAPRSFDQIWREELRG